MRTFLIIVGFITVYNNAIAQEITFTPRIETGAWLFDSKLSADMYGEGKQRTWFEVSETMGVLQLGGTLQLDKFYVEAYAQQSSSASADPNNETLVEDGIDSYQGQEADFERSEYSFLLGYQLSQVSLFMGYRSQETDIEETLDNPQTTQTVRGPDTWDINLDSRGPFLGAKYVMPIKFNSSLAITASIGFFEQDYENAYTMDLLGGGAFDKLNMLFDFETDVVDLGLGLAYTLKLNRQFDLKVLGQLNYYTFDESIDLTTRGDDGPISAGAIDFEADELNFQLRAGLQYHF
ncbi:MAG: hypothetical protein ABFS56_02350 [Pseudomonadota bacterium]